MIALTITCCYLMYNLSSAKITQEELTKGSCVRRWAITYLAQLHPLVSKSIFLRAVH